ncbi:MAG: hypothetical protein OHK0023_00720 [Anaerolineae bacterium]
MWRISRIALCLAMFLALGTTLIAVAQPAHAQPDNPDCDPASLIAELTNVKSTGDKTQDLAALKALSERISAQTVACEGYSFAGEGDKVFGPFTFPDNTTYRVKISTKASISVVAIPMEGECGFLGFVMAEFNLQPEPRTFEDVFEAKQGCRATIKVVGVGSDWTVTLEPMN